MLITILVVIGSFFAGIICDRAGLIKKYLKI